MIEGIIIGLAMVGAGVQVAHLLSRLRPVRRLLIARAIRRVIKAERKASEERRAVRSTPRSTVMWTGHGDVLQLGRTAEVASTASSLPPGRQNISMPTVMVRSGIFASARPWKPEIPADAKSAPWPDLHRFAAGAAERQKSPGGRYLSEEPPIALVCVGCELEQPPLDDERRCPYCGIVMKVHGSRVFWWRDPVEVPEWRATR
ncbi:MAG TPA: hypothetical protein VD970_18040 [Acetobacteraceae bacterium]|nr:hypothetical protein [Acetobacteraceae bacterium]